MKSCGYDVTSSNVKWYENRYTCMHVMSHVSAHETGDSYDIMITFKPILCQRGNENQIGQKQGNTSTTPEISCMFLVYISSACTSAEYYGRKTLFSMLSKMTIQS